MAPPCRSASPSSSSRAALPLARPARASKLLAIVGACSQQVASGQFLAAQSRDLSASAGASGSASAPGPNWGCGLVGPLPGISPDGVASGETQRLIDGIKVSSDFNKVTYWNWDVAPSKQGEHLTRDMIFMPEIWGVGPAQESGLRQAGQAGFPDKMGGNSQAEMATILLGMNEPDMAGTCMGTMFGSCTKPCSQASIAAGDCPVGFPQGPLAEANQNGECNCWQYSNPTGVGFYGVGGCDSSQPLPMLFKQSEGTQDKCVSTVMNSWKETVRVANMKGYKYLSTPLVAVDIGYAKSFIEHACGCDPVSHSCACTDASCGCPVYVGFHFYGNDCQPETLGTYDGFRQHLEDVARIMEEYPFIEGAIINEVGMLNFGFSAIGVPESGKFPGEQLPGHTCPQTEELPNGMATFLEKIMDLVIEAKTADGRAVVKGFSWFNEDMIGGTYNLRLQDEDGNLNQLGETYISSCAKWAQSRAS